MGDLTRKFRPRAMWHFEQREEKLQNKLPTMTGGDGFTALQNTGGLDQISKARLSFPIPFWALSIGFLRVARKNEAASGGRFAYIICQGNCNAVDKELCGDSACSNIAASRITIAIEYPISNCPAKFGRLPSRGSIRTGPARD